MTESLEQRRARFAAFPLHRQLGLELEEAREGFARIVLITDAVTLSGANGGVHGGVLATMVDVAMLEALLASLGPDDMPAGTADLGITYLRPSRGARVTAEATIIRKGRSLAMAEVSILDGEGQLSARGRTIYSIRQRPAS